MHMSFLWHDVSPALRPFVNFLYVARGPMPYAEDGVFPTPSLDVKFNFGEAWRVREPTEGSEISLCTESWCLGIWNKRHIVEWPAETKFLGVSFKPHGAYAFLGVPMSELHNRVVPLDSVWGGLAGEGRERLHEAPTLERRFALLEELLIGRLKERSDDERLVTYVSQRMAACSGAVKIADLCADVGISHKHLITLFKRIVGCTPKELARLLRFEHVLQSIVLGRPVRWTSLAHDNDYFDQAHFSRDFEAHTGLSPSAYLTQRRRIQAETPAHAAVPWVLPVG
jgi:AraC-like DNA-binding protein